MIRKTVIDKFQEHLLRSYFSYCKKHEVDDTAENLLNYLLDRDIILAAQMRRYAVWNEYKKLSRGGKKKTTAIKEIADLLNISERHTWSLIKYAEEKSKKE